MQLALGAVFYRNLEENSIVRMFKQIPLGWDHLSERELVWK